MDKEPNNKAESTEKGKASQWLQDNLRIIISILIVILIAGGIYSYSKRSQVSSPTDQTAQENIQQGENGNTNSQGNTAAPATTGGQKVSAAATSQETSTSFVETAGRGDSQTTLARRALANYLEKNPDSSLTAEHKIYIEDFLRKNVPPKRTFVGTSVEFSKDLIQNAITKSKTLNQHQLQNLHKFAVRVPSLS